MKTLLLAAGGSQAFVDAGFYYPKNLTEVRGMPLIAHVLSGLGALGREGRLLVVARRDEVQRFHIDRVVALLEPTAKVVAVGETSGAACSALLACEDIAADEPLVVCNADQLIKADVTAIAEEFEASGVDAGVIVFPAVHPRWSYVRVEDGLVVEATEKRPISSVAVAGWYWFRRGSDFVSATQDMIRKGASVDGQFYVSPALNQLVLAGRRITVRSIERDDYLSLHSPDGLVALEQHLDSRATALAAAP